LIYVGEGEGRRAPISIRDLGLISRENVAREFNAGISVALEFNEPSNLIRLGPVPSDPPPSPLAVPSRRAETHRDAPAS